MTDPSTELPSRKRITILTYGSRGDVQPFIALGAGLQRSGHAVRLTAPAQFGPMAEAHGLDFEPIPASADELVLGFADRAGLRWTRMVAEMARHALPRAKAVFRAAAMASRDADLIVHSFLMTDAGHTLADLRGVPDVSGQFFPVFLPTAAFPVVAMPNLPFGTAYRRATHLISNAVFRYGARLLY